MARNENAPFSRGESLYNGGTIDSNNLIGGNLLGKVYEFEDLQYNVSGQVGAKSNRTGRSVKCMAVRNVSGVNILPGQLCNLSTTQTDGKDYTGKVDGLARLTAQRGYPADEWLPAAGVPDKDVFYVVIEGPASVLTDLAGGANNVFSVGTILVSLTAATSQATTAGRVAPQDLTGATSLLGNQVQNRIGWALSAATTANTNAMLLAEIKGW